MDADISRYMAQERLLSVDSSHEAIVSYKIVGECEADRENFVDIEWTRADGTTFRTCYRKVDLRRLTIPQTY